MNHTKYTKGYYMPPEIRLDWLRKAKESYKPEKLIEKFNATLCLG